MYISELEIRNVKRLHDFRLSFCGADEPRLWTVLIGANGLCKTAILQCIALAASGPVRGNRLVDTTSLPDLGRRQETARVNASFSFGALGHSRRAYPGLSGAYPGLSEAPQLDSSIFVAPGDTDLQGFASYQTEPLPEPPPSRTGAVTASELAQDGYTSELAGVLSSEEAAHSVLLAIGFPRQRMPDFAPTAEAFWGSVVGELEKGVIPKGIEKLLATAARYYPGNAIFTRWAMVGREDGNGFNPLEVVRAKNIPDWFVAGYGTSRLLARPGEGQRPRNPSEERVTTLFDQGKIIGTEFVRILEASDDYSAALHGALIASDLLPQATGIRMHSGNWARSARDIVRGDLVKLRRGDEDVEVPATWLSQGYQSTIAWIADIVGWFYFERQDPVPLAEMEGLVLIDEIDLHLHPKWQETLIPILKLVFPRLQFVVTTHSPMVLTGLKPEEIVILNQDEAGNVVPVQLTEVPALLTGSQIHDRYFGVRRVQAARLGAAVRRLGVLSNVDTGSLDEEERQELESLRRELTAAGIDLRDAAGTVE